MKPNPVDYDKIAQTYNQRFEQGDMPGVAKALLELARRFEARSLLETGCGTGRWLADLSATGASLYGLDLSLGMLAHARQREARLILAGGRAENLPFRGDCFDLVYCVNALHHFQRPRSFLAEARRVLRAGGALAVIGMNPHRGAECWYLYQYFEGTYETDLARFPAWETLLGWMSAAGLSQLERRTVVRIQEPRLGADVFNDPFLKKESTSQLVLLSDQAYAAGLERIRAAIAEAGARGSEIVFPVDIEIDLAVGKAGA